MTVALTGVSIRHADTSDAARLASLARETFADTFGRDNTAADMALYTAQAFGEDIQRAELTDSRVTVLIAEQNGEAVGYAMLREAPAPDCVGARDAIEVARLYSVRRLIGSGVGAALMQRCLTEAELRGKDVVWLGVWEHNARAIAFYRRWGFADAGTQPFVLGPDRQTDGVMFRGVIGESGAAHRSAA